MFEGSMKTFLCHRVLIDRHWPPTEQWAHFINLVPSLSTLIYTCATYSFDFCPSVRLTNLSNKWTIRLNSSFEIGESVKKSRKLVERMTVKSNVNRIKLFRSVVENVESCQSSLNWVRKLSFDVWSTVWWAKVETIQMDPV